LEVTDFSLIATAGFFPIRLVTSPLRAATTSGSLLTQAVDRWPAGKSILMPKQALGERAVEPLHDSLVSVDFRAPATNSCFKRGKRGKS